MKFGNNSIIKTVFTKVAVVLVLGNILSACNAGSNQQQVENNQLITTKAVTAKYAYIINQNNNSNGNISQYSVESNGTLNSLSTPTITTGKNPIAIVSDPLGKYVYVLNEGDNSIYIYSVTVTGTLNKLGYINTFLSTPTAIAINNLGYVYVTNIGDQGPEIGDISAYHIDESSGMLDGINSVWTGITSTGIVTAPSNNYIYTVDNNNDVDFTVSSYNVGADGLPSEIQTSDNVTPPASITIDSSGTHLYVTNEGAGSISIYSINTQGYINIESTIHIGRGQLPKEVTLSPSGKYAYIPNMGGNSISMYYVDQTTGILNPIGSNNRIVTGTSPNAIVVDSGNSYAYLANSGSNDVYMYVINPDGSLTLKQTSATIAGNPVAILLH